MAKKPLIPVTPSSGNVFADIGVPEPEEALAKAQLASRIRESALASRLKTGRIVYQSDPKGSGLTERIEPNGARTLGRLVNRRFVPAPASRSRGR